MRTQQIRVKIQEAVQEEKRTGRLAKELKAMAAQNRAHPTAADVKSAVKFIQEYIEHVPHFMEEGAAAAAQIGLGAQMNQMCAQLEAYWFEENDLIPDRLGLQGLLDDAYASLVLLQAVSDYCQSVAGRPLLRQDMKAANLSVHGLIGEPIASMLDQMVGVTISQTMMQQWITQLATGSMPMFGNAPDPMWGNASIDEVVTARLGAMGVV
jgi:uncharacterized membrane protein YkvA (DUF1232 family)